MAFSAKSTPWGWCCTISAATAAGNVVVGKGTMVRVSAFVAGGAATTDIITVSDADGNLAWQGCALVGQSDSIAFSAKPLAMAGITVKIAGATTGWVNIVTQ